MPRLLWRVLQFLGLLLGLGVLCALIWAWLARRPGYLVSQELGASLSERGLAEVFSTDALFALLAALNGIAIGLISWWWFRDRGWWVCVAAVGGALAGCLLTWLGGMWILPPTFDARLAAASAGDIIPIDLTLHSMSALLVGPFCAITPVMLLAAFWPESPPHQVPPSEPRRIAAVD
jgi:hypothetical membrane protein